ncbi:Cof-type HAD-IIB family hydrolase [Phenylobacterium sp.]|uniref:Cof-type HAD-IIB family hydrolase n=1 Tax=Phenylobacterium sp. TaxID=1871053 RepID=UPI0011FA863B|nr:Cof-type HAD-IIB family hydrolase [Phenylobacterium sp.]THD60152.1 MAG: HAD family phosphatase [Phenylobacterium sp.]
MTGRSGLRLLLADVDGTLVTDDKQLTPAAVAAVQDLRRAGIAFAITSSRPPNGLRMLVAPLDLQLPLAGLNGGLLVDPDMSVIACYPIGPVAAAQSVNLLLSHQLDVWIYTADAWLVRDPTAAHVTREAWILGFPPEIVTSFTAEHLAQAVKIVGVSDDLDLVAACEAQAQTSLGASASATRSNAYFLDVTNPKANKGAVVVELSVRLGIAPDQIATIGDMPNDVLMFRQSGLSIAMGNASDEVKAQANHVTDSNQDEGFAKAVRNFVLPIAAP